MSTKQSEHLLGFGLYLGREREKRGLTLADINRKTKITLRMLQALEEEDLNVLPADVYARGFIQSYAAALGVDPDEPLQQFDQARKERRPAKRALLPNPSASEMELEEEDGPAPIVTPESAVAAWLAAARRKGNLGVTGSDLMAPSPDREKSGSLGRSPRKVSLAAVLILLIVALILVVSYMYNRPTSTESQSKKPAANEQVNFDLTG